MNTYDVGSFKDELMKVIDEIPTNYTNESMCLTYEQVFPDSNEFNVWIKKLKLLAGWIECKECGTLHKFGESCKTCESWAKIRAKNRKV